MSMDAIRRALTGSVVAVPTTIWNAPGELDLEANVRNADFLLGSGTSAAVFAGGVGEHDRLSTEQQMDLLDAVCSVAQNRSEAFCLGTGLGRTLDRVKRLVPVLAKTNIDFAMTMPPAIDDQDEQFRYYSEVLAVLIDHDVAPMLYTRPEHPMMPELIERLFDRFNVPAVKLAHNGLLVAYAEMVARIGRSRSAWLCGTAGWWMPSYAAVGAAMGMSSGIVNAFPKRPHALLRRINEGDFVPDSDFWTMVRIEQIRQRDKSNIALVIKYLQSLVGLDGGMNGDGAELSAQVKAEVGAIVRDAGWLD